MTNVSSLPSHWLLTSIIYESRAHFLDGNFNFAHHWLPLQLWCFAIDVLPVSPLETSSYLWLFPISTLKRTRKYLFTLDITATTVALGISLSNVIFNIYCKFSLYLFIFSITNHYKHFLSSDYFLHSKCILQSFSLGSLVLCTPFQRYSF